MKKSFFLVLVLLLVFSQAFPVFATNGDNMIGVGAKSRAMGGVGIAAPQDAISAVFANPAAMCFGPYCPGAEFNFDGTLFMPKVSAEITMQSVGGTLSYKKDSDRKVYAIPAIGLSSPIEKNMRFGLAAYGVSGLGVDYRDAGIDLDPSTAGNEGDTSTQLQIMKFAPNLAYLVTESFSVGVGLHVDYSSLDLGSGSSFGYGFGAQVGAIYKIGDTFRIGMTYTTPQNVKHQNVADFDHDNRMDDLELESPQQAGIGIAVEPVPGVVLIGIDAKWINWADAAGYEDFDWDDQYVAALGIQIKPSRSLAFRLGYNYGNNPVNEHDGWDPTPSSSNPNNVVDVQGKKVDRFEYEYLRIIGFPAIVQHHITAGIGYEFSRSFAVNIGYMYALQEDIKETSAGNAVTLKSELSEQSIDFGLTWRF